ncbi:hypothetical protein DFP91_2764 [Pseudorhodoplanes sinuspersici]|nr:hypothetical protein DFP91_2764 [Pseudorhodoplanes sinuspersici]
MTAGCRRNASAKGSFPLLLCSVLQFAVSFEKFGTVAGNLVYVWRWNCIEASLLSSTAVIVDKLEGDESVSMSHQPL